MAQPNKELKRLLKQHGTLVRSKKHLVYRLSNGRTFVLSKSASDHRAAHNALKDLERLLAEQIVTQPQPAPAPQAQQKRRKGKRKRKRK